MKKILLRLDDRVHAALAERGEVSTQIRQAISESLACRVTHYMILVKAKTTFDNIDAACAILKLLALSKDLNADCQHVAITRAKKFLGIET